MSERDDILHLLHWYNTPQSGVTDHEAWEIAKPEIDRLMFRLASLDSGTEINVLPLYSREISFFGETRNEYHPMVEINAKKQEKAARFRETMAKYRANR